jgi:hypothetical protein
VRYSHYFTQKNTTKEQTATGAFHLDLRARMPTPMKMQTDGCNDENAAPAMPMFGKYFSCLFRRDPPLIVFDRRRATCNHARHQ